MLLISGCGALLDSAESSKGEETDRLKNSFTVSPQKAPPKNIQSIQLYRSDSEGHPPIIRLNKEETLTLEFDHLGGDSKQFNVRIRHYTKDWKESSLNPDFYLDGFYEDFFGGGLNSFTQRPSYRHYEYEFPNQQYSITASGNYLMSVFDADDGSLLFALPFFVSEDEGTLDTRVQKLFARRTDLREQDQLFSEFRYPDFVELPRFDLSFYYAQNQFWGRTKKVRFFDTSTPGRVNFHLSQDEAFVGDYEFNTLDIRSLTVDGRRILSFETEFTPPRIILRRDTENLTPVPAFTPGTRFGLPVDSRNAQYADVRFRLETAVPSDSLNRMFLVGDFNNWTINHLNQMTFNPENRLWEGRTMVKQGEYAYKYVVIKGSRVDDLALDRSFTFSRQEYTTLVYFRDPSRHFDRLLKTHHIPQ